MFCILWFYIYQCNLIIVRFLIYHIYIEKWVIIGGQVSICSLLKLGQLSVHSTSISLKDCFKSLKCMCYVTLSNLNVFCTYLFCLINALMSCVIKKINCNSWKNVMKCLRILLRHWGTFNYFYDYCVIVIINLD